MARKVKEELPTREELVALVDEINEVLKLNPAIKVGRKNTPEEIIEMIKTECEGNVYEIDFEPDPEDDTIVVFTEKADELFEKLGIEIQEGSPPDPNAEDEKTEEVDPEPEEVKPAKKESKEKEKVETKPAAKTAKEEPKKGKATPAPAPAKKEKELKGAQKDGKRYTRSNALIEALADPGTKPELVKAADELFVSYGGDSNMTVMELQYRFTMPALFELGIVEKDKDGVVGFTQN